MSTQIFVAVSGQPNCGKSTMFNAITGATARVGNYPGITVDRTEGYYQNDNVRMHLVDLPGTYSLTSYSMEEIVARDVVVDEKPQVVIDMLDATSLERSLYLAVQLMEIGVPMVLGLNMMDEVANRGITINTQALSKALNMPVVECIARRSKGKKELMDAVERVHADRQGEWRPLHISYGEDLDPILDSMVKVIEEKDFMTDTYSPRWLAVRYLEEDEIIIAKGDTISSEISGELKKIVADAAVEVEKKLGTYPEAILADYRFAFVSEILAKDVIRREDDFLYGTSDKIDAIVTQKFLGPIIMAAVMLFMFYLTFTLGAIPQGWVEDGFAWLSDTVSSLLPDGLLKSMLVSGVLDGVGAVMGFTPLILIMFSMLVFLEDLGYMARVAYMVDRVLRMFGLHGMSIMPMIMSGGLPGGCAVPGVMAARTLRSPRERLATILVSPFMVCGAKTTAYLMLVGAFFPGNPTMAMFGIVVGSWILALLTARILRSSVLRGPATPFVMELPPYRLPTLYGVVTHTWERVWQYIKKAGTVILAISILMWALLTFPHLPQERTQFYEAQREAVTAEAGLSDEARKGKMAELEGQEAEEALKYSVAGRISEMISPVTRLAGFPWQADIAFIGAFAAKEVFVSTMATAYSMSVADPDDASTLSERIARDKAWTMASVWSVFVFMLVYVPCMVTVAVIIRESNWKWGLFAVGGSLTFGYALAVLVYQIGTAMGF